MRRRSTFSAKKIVEQSGFRETTLARRLSRRPPSYCSPADRFVRALIRAKIVQRANPIQQCNFAICTNCRSSSVSYPLCCQTHLKCPLPNSVEIDSVQSNRNSINSSPIESVSVTDKQKLNSVDLANQRVKVN